MHTVPNANHAAAPRTKTVFTCRTSPGVSYFARLVDYKSNEEDRHKMWMQRQHEPPEDAVAAVSIGDHLPAEAQAQIRRMLEENRDVLATSMGELTGTHVVSHRIDLIPDAKPFAAKAKKSFTAEEVEFIEAEIKKEVQAGIIEECDGDTGWMAPITIARKRNGKMRKCINYVGLNNVTQSPQFPIPDADELVMRSSGYSLYSQLDALSGYYAVPMHPSSIHLTTFSAPSGCYRYLFMPFGLKGAPYTYSALTARTYRPLIQRGRMMCYFEDAVLLSNNVDELCRDLSYAFSLVRDAGFKLNAKKCSIAQKSVCFLGHEVSQAGLSPDESKLKYLRLWEPPCSLKEALAFVGFVNYFRKYVEHHATILRPITKIITQAQAELRQRNKETKAKRTKGPMGPDILVTLPPDALAAFHEIKEKLLTRPVLGKHTPGEPCHLEVDTSNYATGAICFQHDKPTFYWSKLLTPTQQRYSATEREFLGLILCLKRYRALLQPSVITVVSDHASLRWLVKNSEITSRVARWNMFLLEYDVILTTRPGKELQGPDALSRVTFGEPPDSDDEPSPFILRSTFSSMFARFIRSAYTKDKKLSPIFTYLCGDPLTQYPPSRRKAIRKNARRFVLSTTRDHMYFRDPVDDLLKLVVPRDYVSDAIKLYHGPRMHWGRAITTASIRTALWWPGLSEDVRQACRTCDKCQRFRPRPASSRTDPVYIAFRPFQSVQVDLMEPGGLPVTSAGHRAIITLTDVYTRYLVASINPRQCVVTSAPCLAHAR